MRRFMKITALLCAVCLLAGCGLIGESDKAVEKKEKENSVVTVNGSHISKSRFNYYFYNEQDEILQSAGIANATDIPADFWQQKTDGKTNLEMAKENALAALIDDVLKYQQAVKEDIKISSDERKTIDSQMGQMKQNAEMMSQLEQINVDADTYKELIVESMYIQKLLAKYVDDGKIKIDNKAVQEEFEGVYVKAQHILFLNTDDKTGAALSEDELAKKKALANDVLAKIRAGEDFEALMNEYCEDPGVANAPDGYVFTTGQMVQEFEDTAYSLQLNQVSDIVETSYGFHIIKRVPFDMEGEQEQQYMEQFEYNYAMPEMDNMTKQWKAKAEIEINDKVLKAIEPTIINNN